MYNFKLCIKRESREHRDRERQRETDGTLEEELSISCVAERHREIRLPSRLTSSSRTARARPGLAEHGSGTQQVFTLKTSLYIQYFVIAENNTF